MMRELIKNEIGLSSPFEECIQSTYEDASHSYALGHTRTPV